MLKFTDIIWVALGAPKQEIFMNRLKPHLKKGVAIAIGAAFNFYSGMADAPQRCPEWMRKCHLEFVHRSSSFGFYFWLTEYIIVQPIIFLILVC